MLTMYTWLSKRPEEGIKSPNARVIGSCESPNVGAGNQTCAFSKAASAPNY